MGAPTPTPTSHQNPSRHEEPASARFQAMHDQTLASQRAAGYKEGESAADLFPDAAPAAAAMAMPPAGGSLDAARKLATAKEGGAGEKGKEEKCEGERGKEHRNKEQAAGTARTKPVHQAPDCSC